MNGDICASWSYIAHDWVIKNDMELLVLAKQFHVTSPEIAKLQGYDYLIDIIKGEHQYTLTFSNDNYEFKTLVSKSTKDRGYIVTVEWNKSFIGRMEERYDLFRISKKDKECI